MDFTNIMSFIPSHMAILVVAIYILGIGLKKAVFVADNWITLMLLVFGITFAILLTIINAQYKTMLDAIVNGILQGILCWGVSVGISQVVIQSKKDE